MAEHRRYLKHDIQCPEGKGHTRLLSEWHNDGDTEILNAISCNNLKLRDLSGTGCQWSCWHLISEKMP